MDLKLWGSIMSNDGNPNVFDGGVESRRHAETGNKSGAVPEAEQSSSATSFVRASGPEDKTLKPRAGLASGPSDPAQEPVAWRYRWKLDGEWTSWHVSDHSQSCEGLRDLEEYPLYPRPVSLNREATARIIDPQSFKNWDDLYRAGLNAGDDDNKAMQCADRCYGPDRDRAFSKADAILALIEGRK